MGIAEIQAQVQAAAEAARRAAEEAARRAAEAAARAAQQAAQQAAAQARQQAQQAAQAVRDSPAVKAHLGQSSFDAGSKLNDAARLVSGVPADLRNAGNQIAQGAGAVRDGLSRLGGGDYAKEIDALQNPGDKYVYSQDGSVSATAGVYAKDAIAVERQKGPDGKDRWVVSSDASAGGGIWGDTGVDAGAASLKINANLTAGGGQRVEYSFDNPEDAKRATGALIAMSQASTNPGGLFRNADTIKDLKNHVSAVEYRGEAAAQVQAQAGIGYGPAAANAFAGGKVSTDTCMRVEYANGKPSAVVMREDFQGQLSAGGQFGPAGKNDGKDVSGKSMQNLQANATGKVSVETRYTLPSDVPPGADLNKLLPSCPKSQKVTLTSDVGDNAGGAERKYEINGDPSKILGNPDLTGAFLRGDSKQLLELARAGGDVKVTTRTYSMDAMDLPVSLKIEGWGFSSDHRSERRSYSAPAVVVEPRLEG